MFKHILLPVSRSHAGSVPRSRLIVRSKSCCRSTSKATFDQKMIDELEERARKTGQKRVDAIGKLAKAAGVPFASLVTKASTAYEGIIDAAKKRKCDVIFMALHGHRGLSRLVMGSVTQKVLTHSRIPGVVYR